MRVTGSNRVWLDGFTLTGFVVDGCVIHGCFTQGRLTINNRYTHREFKLKFSALLKDYDLKYAENGKK